VFVCGECEYRWSDSIEHESIDTITNIILLVVVVVKSLETKERAESSLNDGR
jgi:hypothetical protein